MKPTDTLPVVAVASTNPVKLEAARRAFQRVFPQRAVDVISVAVESGVGPQPMTDTETLRGAERRANACRALKPEADYWVGIEGGVDPVGGDLAAMAWVVVVSPGGEGKGRTGTFLLPGVVSELVRAGMELGEADDFVFGKMGSKRENGAVGLLTGDVIDRVALYEHAVILALIPFRNGRLYPPAGRGASSKASPAPSF
jgi:inosine/xanthosine triphosphatase